MTFWRLAIVSVLLATVISGFALLSANLWSSGRITSVIVLAVLGGAVIYGLCTACIAVPVLRKLKRSRERFALAMQGANDGLWDWDLKTNQVYYSPRWKSMLGYGVEELENNLDTWASLVHPDDKDYILKKVQDYIQGNSETLNVEMRMLHKNGHTVVVLSRAFLVNSEADNTPVRLVGTHIDISARKKAETFSAETAKILKMIAIGRPAGEIYNAIAQMYEERHPGMRCSMLELEGNVLLHGGAPSLPQAYCDAVHGLQNGPDVGSCGTSTYTGKRVLVKDIATDPKWQKIKHHALPHGMRSCWSEPIKNSNGDVLGAFGMYYNHPALPSEEESNDLLSAARLSGIVMERDQNQKRIRNLAYTDDLTGLASRARFFEYLEILIQASKPRKRRFCLFYIDLDNFKTVNDSLGHDVGDSLLIALAKRFTSIKPELSFVARLGGDEFCVVVEDLEEKLAAAQLAQQCLEMLSRPIELYARKLSPSCSIGIARYPEDGDSSSSIIKAADTALYAAKERGRNRFAFYRQELTVKAEYNFQFEQDLRGAIENEELYVVYQPQIELKTGRTISIEALSRWRHPTLGEVSPLEFIDMAERIGMIKPLTEWILRSACNQLIQWKQAGLPELKVAVNIPPSLFLDKELITLITCIVNETGINPKELELEVTEGAIQTEEANLNVLAELKDFGITLAIDDFGTGYSSMASLKHLPVDFLKIDRYFIHDMMSSKEAMILMSSMVEMGHKLGYGIVAEGVETEEQLAMIENLGCEKAQGYLFSQPVDKDDLTKLLTHEYELQPELNLTSKRKRFPLPYCENPTTRLIR